MENVADRLDEINQTVMDELKDFQVATVERIDYLYRHGQKRILVSDEVGLGKTLIARGTIARFAKLRKEEGDNLVKVVYICSNAAIAEQNLDKLRITNEIRPESTHTSRLSMQHLNIFKQEYDGIVLKRYIQLIPLTPETSFKVTNSQGTVSERALMYAILRRIPKLQRRRKKLEEIFRFDVRSWDWARDEYENRVVECDRDTNGEYLKYMLNELSKYSSEIDELSKLCYRHFDRRQAKPLIVMFRMIFSDISLNKLDPDLIIMDEFQRFKYLLDNSKNSEMGRLTSKFFNTGDLRILMLSATPYKMYSTLDEIDEEEIDAHYREFFDVVNFLKRCGNKREEFRQVWSNYSIRLKELSNDRDSFIIAKRQAENRMFENICRTERITEKSLADFIDGSDAKNSLSVLKEDINSYAEAQKLLDEIGLNMNVPMDYVKSTPYLMSFMKHYQLKRRIERYFKRHPKQINKIKRGTFWLDENEIDEFHEIPRNNARLENLMGHVMKDNAANLLWAPPSLPYYDLRGAFKDSGEFTKTLIFSSWEMVPRMISSLVSYEVERQTIGQLPRKSNYFAENRYPSSRMRFALRRDVPAQMSLFTLIYPSEFLIGVYNPIDSMNSKMSLEDIESEIKKAIKSKLDEIPSSHSIREDLKWYHLAPLLMDSSQHVELWFSESEKLIDSGYFYQKGFLTHYWELKKQYYDVREGRVKLGIKPADLVDVLCDVAIAAPGVCVYRSYERELPKGSSMDVHIIGPTQIARKFIDRMNLPESIAVIDRNFRSTSEDAYWKNVLKYSKDGNLQAVFDEYVHLLSNGLDSNNEDRIAIINDKLIKSFEFRTTSYDIDTFETFRNRITKGDKFSYSMRTHFAVSFTKGKSDESDTNRKKSVRDAFNSPFRPFVLASTSIGQEGLDFHNYCRRIVHWNLPSNPIDLEQREGRINRFECLAIRQNVAKRYGGFEFESENIWTELFSKASENEKSEECSDLIPYWGLKESEDMVKIERIVPMYPFSRDELKYDRLIKILSLYRLTLGQSRQEELIDKISKDLDDGKDINELFINLSPYYKDEIDDFEVVCEEDETSDVPNEQLPDSNVGEELMFAESQDNSLSNQFEYGMVTNDFEEMRKIKMPINLSEKDLFNYWSCLLEKAEGMKIIEGELISCNSIAYWISIPGVILNMARIEMLIEEGYLRVMLYHPPSEHIDSLYYHLSNQKDEIEKELGFELDWVRPAKNRLWRINIFTPFDINDKNSWDDAINWHVFMAKRFEEVFSLRIQEFYGDNPLRLNNKLRTQYWTKLTEKLDENKYISIQVPHSQVWYSILLENISVNYGRIELHAYTHIKQIKASFILENNMHDLFEFLHNDRLAIEEELGFELDWVKSKGRRHIRKTYKIDIRNKDNWTEAIDWQLNMVEKFSKVFNHRVKDFFENKKE